jgi:hypothetical protein
MAFSVTLFLLGCGTTTTVNVHSETKMVTGEQMSCIYHGNNLYCASPLLKVEDIDKLQIMSKVVSVVSHEEKESDMKEGGSFSTKFASKPKEYSLWNCSSTGVAEPAIKCTLLREADQKLVEQQEREIKLNETQETKLQYRTTEQSIISACGSPIEQRDDSISHTIYFPSSQTGVLMEVEFSTLEKPQQLEHIETVDTSNAHAFVVQGVFWNNFANIGKTDEDHVASIRQYFPCILK